MNTRAQTLHQASLPTRESTRPRAGWSRLLRRLGALLGFRQRIVVAGVRYTERSFEPLRRALSRKGSGRKDFEAIFPDGTRLRIRATQSRVFADLAPPRLLPLYELCSPLLRPGMRVLDLACSTGWSAAWIARQLGPSGAVVALDRDREAVTYAVARYRAGAIAFEQGFVESLAGELDGAFSGAIAVGALTEADDPKKSLAEMWRVVAPGGFLVVAQPNGRAGAAAAQPSVQILTDSQLRDLIESAIGATVTPLPSLVPDFSAALARKAVQP